MGTILIDEKLLKQMTEKSVITSQELEEAFSEFRKSKKLTLDGDGKKMLEAIRARREIFEPNKTETSRRLVSEGDVGDLALKEVLIREIDARAESEAQNYAFRTSLALYGLCAVLMLMAGLIVAFGNIQDSLFSSIFALSLLSLSCGVAGFSYVRFSSKFLKLEASSQDSDTSDNQKSQSSTRLEKQPLA